MGHEYIRCDPLGCLSPLLEEPAPHRRRLHAHAGGHDEMVRMADGDAGRHASAYVPGWYRRPARDNRRGPAARWPVHAARRVPAFRGNGGLVLPVPRTSWAVAPREPGPARRPLLFHLVILIRRRRRTLEPGRAAPQRLNGYEPDCRP